MNCIRGYDGFSRPVLLMYKGEEEFNTVVGGCFSILTTILLVMYGSQQMASVFANPAFSQQTDISYQDFTENHDGISLDTVTNTLAVQLMYMPLDKLF